MHAHQQLDKYLAQLRMQLRALPQAQRESELREVQGHLQAIVESRIEQGENEDAATAAALEQFGSPKQVANGLKTAYRLQPESWVNVFVAIAAAVVAHMAGWALDYYVRQPMPGLLKPATGLHLIFNESLSLIRDNDNVIYWLCTCLAGVIAGIIAPRRGIYGLLLMSIPFQLMFAPFLVSAFSFESADKAIYLLTLCLGWWYGSRCALHSQTRWVRRGNSIGSALTKTN